MLTDRLNIALAEQTLSLPAEGRIAVVGPAPDTDLSDLPKERVEIVSRHFPAHDAFRRKGFAVATDPVGPYTAAILCLPRAKAEARLTLSVLAQVTDGPIAIDGQKTDGIEAMLKDMRRRATVEGVVVKAHGKLFVVNDLEVSDWTAAPQRISDPEAGEFLTAPGAFSADGIDPGSRALAKVLPSDLKGSVIDLGSGWGYLTRILMERPKVSSVDLVEADHAALAAARRNVTDPRARFHWADALDFKIDQVDHVVTNPPFHQGRKVDPALGQGFIRAAARLLKPKGQLWLVANRHLPYEAGAGRDVQRRSHIG